jgi:hypothetical protein
VIVFVPLDEDGRPKRVPPWTPETDRDRELQAYARRLIEFRKALESEAQGHRMLGD